MENSQATAFLQHLKVAVLKFETAYGLLVEARQELHAVAANFKLDTVQLPEGTLSPAATAAANGDNEGTFEVAVWRNDTGSKLKASGLIDGTDFRVLFFESDKEGIALSGSIVPNNTPEGSELKDIKVGYVVVKPTKDGKHELSMKFDQLDFWFTGYLVPFVNANGNPKAPTFKATMHKQAGSMGNAKNAFADVFKQIELPAAAIHDPVQAVQEITQVHLPVEESAPVIDDVPAPAVPQTLFEMAAAKHPVAPAPEAKPNTLFAQAVPELPSLNLPTWMTGD